MYQDVLYVLIEFINGTVTAEYRLFAIYRVRKGMFCILLYAGEGRKCAELSEEVLGLRGMCLQKVYCGCTILMLQRNILKLLLVWQWVSFGTSMSSVGVLFIEPEQGDRTPSQNLQHILTDFVGWRGFCATFCC